MRSRIWLLLFFVAFAAAGCGGTKEEPPPPSASEQADAEPSEAEKLKLEIDMLEQRLRRLYIQHNGETDQSKREELEEQIKGLEAEKASKKKQLESLGHSS